MPTLFSTMGHANVRLIEVPLCGGLLPFPADHWRSGIRPVLPFDEGSLSTHCGRSSPRPWTGQLGGYPPFDNRILNGRSPPEAGIDQGTGRTS